MKSNLFSHKLIKSSETELLILGSTVVGIQEATCKEDAYLQNKVRWGVSDYYLGDIEWSARQPMYTINGQHTISQISEERRAKSSPSAG